MIVNEGCSYRRATGLGDWDTARTAFTGLIRWENQNVCAMLVLQCDAMPDNMAIELVTELYREHHYRPNPATWDPKSQARFTRLAIDV
jgi:hypothetical protein